MGYWEMRAALEWQVAMGADEAILDAPLDRYAASAAREAAKSAPEPTAAASSAPSPPKVDAVAVAEAAAAAAKDLDSLRAAMTAFEHCDLKKGARQLVFADGRPEARVMIVGEAPGRDEDLEGRPFVGRAGQLLDQMFDAIGLSREANDPKNALYITNVLPWRPPQNRDPAPDEAAMMLPFLKRHIALAAPDILIAMGNHACEALVGRRGITRIRGKWSEAEGRPCLPMFHPSYLLRTPVAKREAWADLLSLQARLRA